MTVSGDPLLLVRDLGLRYTSDHGIEVEALTGVNLLLHPGEMLAIVGPSGSGKSSLLRCLVGLTAQTRGTVQVDGCDRAPIGSAQHARFLRDDVGVVFQDYNLLPFFTVMDNLIFPRRGDLRRRARKRVAPTLGELGIAGIESKFPGELSGGQQQRVAIARVLIQQPKLVIADEPTGALDIARSAEVMTSLRGYGVTPNGVILATHDLEAAALADRVIILVDGFVRHELYAPTPAEILSALQNATRASGSR